MKINYLGFLGFLGFMGFEDPWYFLFFFFFLFFFATTKPAGVGESPIMPELVQRQAKEKAENKVKILEMLASREKITNNDVEKLVEVSNATAERYLDELEGEGKLKQVGKTGQSVFYSKP